MEYAFLMYEDGDPHTGSVVMLNGAERESFALRVMEEVRRWPGVEMHPHASPSEPGAEDGIEFRLYGRQFGHMHQDCGVHIAFTKALKETVIKEQLAEPLDVAPRSGWTMFNPTILNDADRAIWLLRLNYIRMRRQRMAPTTAASSELLQRHEAAITAVSSAASLLLQKTQARSRPRPFPTFEESGASPTALET